MINIKVPGKLYLAGEYAVLYPNNPAVLFSVNRFINVSIGFRDNDGIIKDNGLTPVIWTRDHISYSHKNDDYFDVLFASIRITDQYLFELGIDLKYYDITVETELKDSGIKIGLGSSAAISVGAIKGILGLYNIEYNNLLIYKLAVLAHLDLNLEGSFGDIASCSFTGVISYTAVDRHWLKEFIIQNDLITVLKSNWELLFIEELPLIDFAYCMIGWTKASASTQDMVKELKRKPLSTSFIEYFKKENFFHVNKVIDSIKMKDLSLFKFHLNKVRCLLLELEKEANIIIETTELSKLVEISHEFNGVAKSSGAGGGDCGISFFDDNDNSELISKLWNKSNIKNLEMSIYKEDQ